MKNSVLLKAIKCRHFSGQMPCVFNKEKGIKCNNCQYFSTVRERILIIKLGSLGDVLRTTPILWELKKRYKKARIIWLTEERCAEILNNNPLIDEIWDVSFETMLKLQLLKFDYVLNFDNSIVSSAITSLSQSKTKKGFVLDENGVIQAIGKPAEFWLTTAIFDDTKRENRKTYQEMMFEVCNFKFNARIHKMVLNLSPDEEKFAKQFISRYHLRNASFIIGMNIGAGGRWKMKKWTSAGFVGLAKKLINTLNAKIIIMGGNEESRKIILEKLKKESNNVVEGNSDNSVKHFASLINLCDILVTGDTLGMHIALAFNKKVVVLFGPTSSAEIELYNKGIKVIPDIECICCYRSTCDKKPNCMESIKAEKVFKAVLQLLKK